MPSRIDALTDAQLAQMDAHADRWIEVGLRTGPADRERFEAAAKECYRYAGIEWPGVVVWVPSPLVLAFTLAAPEDGAVDGAVSWAVGEAVGGAVGEAVRGAVDGAVGGAVNGAVHGAVGEAVDGAVHGAVRRTWYKVIGGQFWAGGWWWGPAHTSYFRDVCQLELPGDTWERARAYEATVESACWWFPHRRFVMVCERPSYIRRELTDPARPRGQGSHRLHCEDGPAVAWPDGWGVWSIHGVGVPRHVVEAPETLTPAEILGEANAEVRRVMIERFGAERLMREAAAERVQQDDYGTLWRLEIDEDEPLVMIEVVNSTAEADGSRKRYWLRVPPDMDTARAAVAWTFAMRADEYVLASQS